jgi:hypothetical protein
MSNKAINWAYAQHGIKGGTKFVLVTLADMADQEHSCFPGNDMLATLTGFSVSAVREQVKKLHAAGLVRTERRHRKNGARNSDRYFLAVDGPFEAPEIQAPETGGTSNDLAPESAEPSARISADLPPESGAAYKEEPKEVNPQTEPTDLTLIVEFAHPEPMVTLDELFDRFWKAYPRRVERKAASRAFERAIAKLGHHRGFPAERATDYLIEVIRTWTVQWVQHEQRTPDKIPHAASWLNGERWTDELPAVATPRATAGAPPGMHRSVAATLSLVERIAQQEAQHEPHGHRPALRSGVDDRPHRAD